MNLERLADEYVKSKQHLDALTKRTNQLKDLITSQIDTDGTPDEKGHRWLQVGRWQLQRQRRQGDPYLNREAAEQWARDLGVWDEVKVVKEELDADALAGWLYEHRKGTNPETGRKYEDEYRELFITPAETWAFMPPKEREQSYDDY